MGEYLVTGYQGLGDSIYKRPFVRALLESDDRPVWVETCWPQLFEDMNVRCFPPEKITLRTQRENVDRRRGYRDAARPPASAYPIDLSYSEREVRRGASIYRTYRARTPLRGREIPALDLPMFNVAVPIRDAHLSRLAIIRPCTVRREWPNPARNCDARYLAHAADELARRGYYVVAVANLAPGEEDLVMPAPRAHEQHLAGLPIPILFELVRLARVIVSPVGWIVPAALAYGTPLACLLGGQLGATGPAVIAPGDMPLSKPNYARFISPDDPCPCFDRQHACRKTIRDFPFVLSQTLDDLRDIRRAA